MPSAENMNVQMRHRFAGDKAVVYNNPEPVFKPALFCDFRNGKHQMRQYFRVGILRFCQPFYGLYREEKNVRRSLRIDVVYRGAEIVAVNNLGGNFACQDFLE